MRITVKGDEKVIHDFETFAAELPPDSEKVVSKALLNIKTDWRRAWRGKFDHAPRIHLAIDYEITESNARVVRGEVGPRDDPWTQGFLGGILEFGDIHSGPHPGGIPAAEREGPRFEAATLELVRKLTN